MKTTLIVILIAMIPWVANGQENERKTKEKVADTKKEMSEVDKSIDKATRSETKNYAQFKRDTEKKLDKIDRNIADIDSRILKLDANERTKYEGRVKDLKTKNKEMRAKLNGYKDDNDMDKLAEFQNEFQRDMQKLDKALDDFFVDNKK